MSTAGQLKATQDIPLQHNDADKQKTIQQLQEVIGESRDVLVRASSVFPLSLFPDTITIDRTKLTITRREFFKAAEIISMPLEDILTVEATVGPFFGTIMIDTRYITAEKPFKIEHFWRDDALRVKRIAQGYILAQQKQIDCSSMPTDELAKMLDEMGSVSEAERV